MRTPVGGVADVPISDRKETPVRAQTSLWLSLLALQLAGPRPHSDTLHQERLTARNRSGRRQAAGCGSDVPRRSTPQDASPHPHETQELSFPFSRPGNGGLRRVTCPRAHGSKVAAREPEPLSDSRAHNFTSSPSRSTTQNGRLLERPTTVGSLERPTGPSAQRVDHSSGKSTEYRAGRPWKVPAFPTSEGATWL